MVVGGIDASLSFWRDALGIKLNAIEDVPSEGAKLELVQATESGLGLFRFLEKRGPGMHHICLEVDDIQGMMDRLTEKGARLINDTPQVESGGKKCAFIHPKST